MTAGEALTVQLLNYKKDGTPFWNQLQLEPVKDATGSVTTYVGAQMDISVCAASSTGDGAVMDSAALGILPVSERDTDPMTSIASLLSCEAEGQVRNFLYIISVNYQVVKRVCVVQSLLSVFPTTKETFVLSNPHLPDCPMTHVSDGFLQVRPCIWMQSV